MGFSGELLEDMLSVNQLRALQQEPYSFTFEIAGIMNSENHLQFIPSDTLYKCIH